MAGWYPSISERGRFAASIAVSRRKVVFKYIPIQSRNATSFYHQTFPILVHMGIILTQTLRFNVVYLWALNVISKKYD